MKVWRPCAPLSSATGCDLPGCRDGWARRLTPQRPCLPHEGHQRRSAWQHRCPPNGYGLPCVRALSQMPLETCARRWPPTSWGHRERSGMFVIRGATGFHDNPACRPATASCRCYRRVQARPSHNRRRVGNTPVKPVTRAQGHRDKSRKPAVGGGRGPGLQGPSVQSDKDFPGFDLDRKGLEIDADR